jgi:hypothetical protein
MQLAQLNQRVARMPPHGIFQMQDKLINPRGAMDVYAIRFSNFNALFRGYRERHADQPERGMLKGFAESIGVSDRHLSHIKHQRSRLGSAIARQIEAALGLPHGWMDQLHDGTAPENAGEHAFVETALLLYRAAPEDAQAQMLKLLRERLTKRQP